MDSKSRLLCAQSVAISQLVLIALWDAVTEGRSCDLRLSDKVLLKEIQQKNPQATWSDVRGLMKYEESAHAGTSRLRAQLSAQTKHSLLKLLDPHSKKEDMYVATGDDCMDSFTSKFDKNCTGKLREVIGISSVWGGEDIGVSTASRHIVVPQGEPSDGLLACLKGTFVGYFVCAIVLLEPISKLTKDIFINNIKFLKFLSGLPTVLLVTDDFALLAICQSALKTRGERRCDYQYGSVDTSTAGQHNYATSQYWNPTCLFWCSSTHSASAQQSLLSSQTPKTPFKHSTPLMSENECL